MLRGNNWRIADLSEASFNSLASSLQGPDCEEIFKSSTLYYGSGGTAVLHLSTTIRLNRIRNVMDLDWKTVQGSIDSIVSNLKAAESPLKILRFSSVDKKSANISLISTRREDAAERLGAEITGEPEAAAALSPVNVNHYYQRLEKALTSENEEKKRITQQFLRIHQEIFGGSVPEKINADVCKQIADKMISKNTVGEKRNCNYIFQLERQITVLQSKNQKLERAYSELDQFSKEQGMEAKQHRRQKAVRKSQRGWDNSASTWVDRASR